MSSRPTSSVIVTRVGNHDLPAPFYENNQDVAFALRAAQEGRIPLGRPSFVPTGFSYELMSNYELLVRPRADWAMDGLMCFSSSPAIVDEKTGELGVVLMLMVPQQPSALAVNQGPVLYRDIRQGEVVASAVLIPTSVAVFVERLPK